MFRTRCGRTDCIGTDKAVTICSPFEIVANNGFEFHFFILWKKAVLNAAAASFERFVKISIFNMAF